MTRLSRTGRQPRLSPAWIVVLLALGWGTVSAGVADAEAPTSPRAGLRLEPTATCPQEALDELNTAIEFVRSQAWTDRPGGHSLNLAPDLDTCRVILNIGQLSDEEEAALQAGAGSRLAIEYRRDWARPSRLLLILWVVFGGSGVIWVYRRYGRR